MEGLRLSFKYPERFAGVAAREPAIEATLRWRNSDPLDSFYPTVQYEEKLGSPVHAKYWEGNHPITIAANSPERLKDAGLTIYFECGDEYCRVTAADSIIAWCKAPTILAPARTSVRWPDSGSSADTSGSKKLNQRLKHFERTVARTKVHISTTIIDY